MCGITFFLSKKKENIIKNLLNSLQIIQNRGYDSMGICYYNINFSKYEIIKYASTFNEDCYNILESNINSNNIQSYVGLGHTRWATHGGKTDYNSHPHISNNKNIILVHNGIINNYETLKAMLLDNDYNFYSETDTEVIANLIEYYILNMNYNIEDAINETINKLEGTWALVIIYTKDLDTYYVTRHGSPLLLGTNDNYTIVTSEINGFTALINDYISINNHDIIKINNNNYNSIKQNEYLIKHVPYDSIVDLSNNEHWMHKEIIEQVDTIQKAYNYGGRIVDNNIKLGGLEHIINIYEYIEYVLLIGCGTSYNAALIGEIYLKKLKNFIFVKAINACEFTNDDIPKLNNNKKILCIFLSQSGETIDVYNCLKITKEVNCINIGIINKIDSLIAREVDCGIYLNCGTEISVASTKSFSSMLIVLSLIKMWFIKDSYNNIEEINNLRFLSSTINHLLYDFNILNKIDLLKEKCINYNNIFILGKGLLNPIAHEAALKIKEVCYIHCEGFSAASLKHGPFALLDNNNLTLLLINYNDSKNYSNLKSTYYEILARNTNIFIITNSQVVIDELKLKSNDYLLLYKLSYYNEIIFIIALQYLAYQISIEKGINPDKPRNLAKVVTVE